MLKRHTTGQYVWKLRNRVEKSKNFIARKFYMWRYNHTLIYLGSYLPLSAHFDEMPTFPHGVLGIFVSHGAKIGKGCTIFQQVTIGSNTLQDSKKYGAPMIGDNVYIGCGAKIIGGIKIGNNVRIGANCVVSMDIPDNATVVLPASRIIVHAEKRDNTFTKLNIQAETERMC